MINGKDLSERLKEHSDYAAYMARELLAAGHPPPKPLPDLSKLTAAEKEAYYLAMQPESTRAAILRQKARPPEEDLEFLLRPIPKEYLANPEAKTLEDLTGERNVSAKDYNLHKSTQRGRNSLGDSRLSSVDKPARERGIFAFTYSKAAPQPSVEELKRLKRIAEIEAVRPDDVQPTPPKPKKTLWQRFLAWYGKSEENVQ